MDLRAMVGSGDRVATFTLPFLIVGVIWYLAFPSSSDVGGPSDVLRWISIVVLIVGVTIWLWSVVLILTHVPRGELITGGPYSLMVHPLYTAVALLVLPWLGFLLNTWVGVVVGVAMYVGSRRYAPAEEAALSRRFGSEWDDYRAGVKFPWL